MDRLLRAHFFRALVHNDLIAPRGDTELTWFHALALATLPGFFFAHGALVRYVARAPAEPALREAAIVSDRAFLVALSMLALGFVAVWAWDELLPTRRDFAVLGPLPLAGPQLLRAKAAAVMQLLGVCALALNLFSTLVFPLVGGPRDASPLAAVGRVVAHLLALLAACAFVGFAAVAARGFLADARALRALQLSAFVALVQSLFLLPAYLAAVRRPDGHELWLLALPPTWFVGLYATLAGGARPLEHGLALVAAVAVATSWLACRSSYRAAGERASGVRAPGRPSAAPRRVERWLNRFVLPSPGQRAAFWFVLAGLVRSTRHRLTLTGYAAVGLAASGLVGGLANRALAEDLVPLQPLLVHATFVGMFFLLLGLRSAFGVPAELRANWLFRAAGPAGADELRRGARKGAAVVAALPVLASLPPLAAAGPGAGPLFVHLACGLAVAHVAVLAALGRGRGMPLASPYVPGASNLRLLWPLYVLSFFAFVSLAGALERTVQHDPRLLLALLAGAPLVSALLRLRERRAGAGMRLEEEQPDAWLSLRLDG